MKFIGESYSLYAKDIHQIWCRSAKFLWKSKFRSESGSGSGSWYYFGFQYQTYISYIAETHQILFGSANSFKSYCKHPDIQTDRQTDGNYFGLFCLLRHTNHEHLSKGEHLFSFTHAITILYPLLTPKTAAFVTCRAVKKWGNARPYTKSRKKREERRCKNRKKKC